MKNLTPVQVAGIVSAAVSACVAWAALWLDLGWLKVLTLGSVGGGVALVASIYLLKYFLLDQVHQILHTIKLTKSNLMNESPSGFL
ncbi:MAG: hypothetical protein KGP34_04225, partial [Bacteroidetes bacterium]|nr:hypothetical protein [Bacteroidota bacterium]